MQAHKKQLIIDMYEYTIIVTLHWGREILKPLEQKKRTPAKVRIVRPHALQLATRPAYC
jgi:hypothetical protein